MCITLQVALHRASVTSLEEVQELNRTSVHVVHPRLAKLRSDNLELDRLRRIAMAQISATAPRCVTVVLKASRRMRIVEASTSRRLRTAEEYRLKFLDPFTGAAPAAQAIRQVLAELPTYEAVSNAALNPTGPSLYALDHGALVSLFSSRIGKNLKWRDFVLLCLVGSLGMTSSTHGKPFDSLLSTFYCTCQCI
jgi:hypothetical protein